MTTETEREKRLEDIREGRCEVFVNQYQQRFWPFPDGHVEPHAVIVAPVEPRRRGTFGAV